MIVPSGRMRGARVDVVARRELPDVVPLLVERVVVPVERSDDDVPSRGEHGLAAIVPVIESLQFCAPSGEMLYVFGPRSGTMFVVADVESPAIRAYRPRGATRSGRAS